MKTKIAILSIISIASIAVAVDVKWSPEQMPIPAMIHGAGKPIILSENATIENIVKTLTIEGVAPISIQIIPKGNKYCVTAQYRKPNPLLEK